MSTSNRFARVIDRARALTRELEGTEDIHQPAAALRLSELKSAEERSLLLVRAMRSGYLALSAFAAATLLSLFGAVLHTAQPRLIGTFEALAVAAGVIAVASLMQGSVLLVRETKLVVKVLNDRAAGLRLRASAAQDPAVIARPHT
jgi:hypothetical protein